MERAISSTLSKIQQKTIYSAESPTPFQCLYNGESDPMGSTISEKSQSNTYPFDPSICFIIRPPQLITGGFDYADELAQERKRGELAEERRKLVGRDEG